MTFVSLNGDRRKKSFGFGAGKSGIASARFLAERGAVVALHDRKPVEEWSEAATIFERKLTMSA